MRSTGEENRDSSETRLRALREYEEHLESLIAPSVDCYWEQDESHRCVLTP